MLLCLSQRVVWDGRHCLSVPVLAAVVEVLVGRAADKIATVAAQVCVVLRLLLLSSCWRCVRSLRAGSAPPELLLLQSHLLQRVVVAAPRPPRL